MNSEDSPGMQLVGHSTPNLDQIFNQSLDAKLHVCQKRIQRQPASISRGYSLFCGRKNNMSEPDQPWHVGTANSQEAQLGSFSQPQLGSSASVHMWTHIHTQTRDNNKKFLSVMNFCKYSFQRFLSLGNVDKSRSSQKANSYIFIVSYLFQKEKNIHTKQQSCIFLGAVSQVIEAIKDFQTGLLCDQSELAEEKKI